MSRTRKACSFALVSLMLLLAVKTVSASPPRFIDPSSLSRSEIQLGETTNLVLTIQDWEPHLITIKVSSTPSTQIYGDTRTFRMEGSPSILWFGQIHEERFVIEPRETGRYLLRAALWSDNQLVDAREFRLTVQPLQGQIEGIVKFQPISVTGISISIVSASVIAIVLVTLALARRRR